MQEIARRAITGRVCVLRMNKQLFSYPNVGGRDGKCDSRNYIAHGCGTLCEEYHSRAQAGWLRGRFLQWQLRKLRWMFKPGYNNYGQEEVYGKIGSLQGTFKCTQNGE